VKSYNELLIITGGLGHIGSSLFQSSGSNERLIIINDNLMAERYCSSFGYHGKKNIKFVFGDIRDKNTLNSIKKYSTNKVESRKINIVHLAAMTDAASSFEKADTLKENNLNGTCAALELANDIGANFIFPSSTSVYGDNSEIVDENSILYPQSPYAESKILEEEYVAKYHRSVILRLGTIVGPSQGMRFHTAVNSFIWKAITGQKIQIWKTAYNQKRPYLCLDDFVRFIHHILDKEFFDANVFNILSENSTPKKITDIIRKIIPNTQIEFVDSKIMNQLSYEVSTSLVESKGFHFNKTIEESIIKTIEFLENYEK
tara:strand:+ start:21342 stop:22289 length:948 start_codon:yes stop_codon:yes gene_type:complete